MQRIYASFTLADRIKGAAAALARIVFLPTIN
jgi:hypothetical protein